MKFTVQPSSPLSRIIHLQQSSILEEFRDHGTTCLIATTHERLLQHSEMYGWSVSTISRIKPSSALVIQKQELEPELWVRIGYRRYRSAFLQFLGQHYDLRPTSIPSNLQVDHLHPSSRFTKAHGAYFIRLALVDQSVNASYGAGFERLLYERERHRELVGGIHMDWMAYLKIIGTRIPSKLAGTDLWKIWAWQYAKSLEPQGFDAIFSYVGLTIMLNLAYQDVWKPLPPHSSFKSEVESHPSYACVPQLSDPT